MSRHTVSDLFERYLTHLERRRRAPSTIRCYRSAYARAKPRLGAIPADRIDLADLCELHEDWHETPVLADRTISYISAALTHAERLGWRPIGSNPCKLIERYAPKPELVPVDRETLVKILDAVDDLVAAEEIDLVSATCFRLLVFTGARLKEILTAKWSFLDLEEAVLHLPKAKRGARDVALPDEALAVLAHLPRLGPYICPGRDPRKPRVEVRRAWAKVVRRVGCRGLRRHDLRHGFATALHEANVPLAQIGELLGHRDPRTTNRYAHPRVGRLRGEISAVLRRRSA
ncbi:MAG: site-specific integrase [Myxococcales bacterium]|nr:site-specific integrase [Myxococcales bacterium]